MDADIITFEITFSRQTFYYIASKSFVSLRLACFPFSLQSGQNPTCFLVDTAPAKYFLDSISHSLQNSVLYLFFSESHSGFPMTEMI